MSDRSDKNTGASVATTPERAALELSARVPVHRLSFEDPWEMHRFFPHIPKGERGGGHGGVPAL